MDGLNLVSMKLTDADKKADKSAMCGPCDVDAPDYPWGLRLRFSEKELDKLGMKDLPQVGSELHVLGCGKVVEVHASDGNGGTRRGFELIMTEMALAPKTEAKSTADMLYGGKEG